MMLMVLVGAYARVTCPYYIDVILYMQKNTIRAYLQLILSNLSANVEVIANSDYASLQRWVHLYMILLKWDPYQIQLINHFQ